MTDKRIAELDALADVPSNDQLALTFCEAWRTWLRDAALRGLDPKGRQDEDQKATGTPDQSPMTILASPAGPDVMEMCAKEELRERKLSQIAFERYEALYENVLYTTSDVAMLGSEHQQRARRAVYEAVIAECNALPLAPLAEPCPVTYTKEDCEAMCAIAVAAALKESDAKLNAVAKELGHPKDAWKTAGCDVLAHYVRDTIANSRRFLQRAEDAERKLRQFITLAKAQGIEVTMIECGDDAVAVRPKEK